MAGGIRSDALRRRAFAASGFVALWIVLAGEQLTYTPAIAIGAVAATIAVAEVLWPRRRWRWRPLAALRFAAHFLWISLLGGIDVARRVLRIRAKIEPAMEVYDLALDPESPAAALFVGVVSLVPGTLCADVQGNRVWIHAIDRTQDHGRRLRDLQARAARVFVAASATRS